MYAYVRLHKLNSPQTCNHHAVENQKNTVILGVGEYLAIKALATAHVDVAAACSYDSSEFTASENTR